MLSLGTLVRLGLAGLALAGPIAACSSTPSGPSTTSAEVGATHYAKTCALCHGAHGEGYVADNATALNNAEFLTTASDDFLRRSIARGRPGTTMSAWDRLHGGPHDEDAIVAIASYLRTWQKDPSIALSEARIPGDPGRGATTYAARCASCHGATGTEGPNVHLGNAEFLAVASDAFLERAILRGRPGTAMQGYQGKLQFAEVADLVALLRSWAKPVATGDVPIPGTLGPIIAHPDGPEPAFVVGNRYTSADAIKAELDRGAAFGFLDARPPSDYVTSHIAGAASVPFYEAKDYLFALPKDKWLVSYCGCPHAESGQLADALLSSGFTKVTILDEGFYVWKDRGYPVRTGAIP